MNRDVQVFAERLGGDTLREIGERHGISHETVRTVYRRAAREHVDQLVLAMWVAQKQGEVVMLAVPSWVDGDDQHRVLSYLEWLLSQFEARDDVVVKVHYRPTTDGSFVFALEDVSFTPTQEAS